MQGIRKKYKNICRVTKFRLSINIDWVLKTFLKENKYEFQINF
jgi:hypothetical protein